MAVKTVCPSCETRFNKPGATPGDTCPVCRGTIVRDYLINIELVEQSLRDLLIPVTEKTANLMGRPRVVVNDDTLSEAYNLMLGEPPNMVAKYLARQRGYRLDNHGRWDWFHSDRYAPSVTSKSLPERFDPTEPQKGHLSPSYDVSDTAEYEVTFHVTAQSYEDANLWAKKAIAILDQHQNDLMLDGRDGGAVCSGHVEQEKI